jgi:hypothetical protein
MTDKNFMNSDGIEIGYFDKRKQQFNQSLQDGISFATNQKQSSPVKSKAKFKKPTPAPAKVTPPNQLTGQEFVERMKQAREAKAKTSK